MAPSPKAIFQRIGVFMIGATLLADHSYSTSIVVFRGKDALVIAADSKETIGTTQGNLYSKGRCKIHYTSGVVYGFSGLVASEKTGFWPDEIARGVILKAGTVDVIAKRFVDASMGPLQKAIEQMQRDSPVLYDTKVRHRSFSAIFGKLESGHAKVSVIEFKEIGTGSKIILQPRITFDPGHTTRVIIGNNKAGNRYLGTGNAITDARRIIQIEIADSPGDVGGPVDEAILDAQGFSWIPPYGSCGR
jgi:hypothetical protein